MCVWREKTVFTVVKSDMNLWLTDRTGRTDKGRHFKKYLVPLIYRY